MRKRTIFLITALLLCGVGAKGQTLSTYTVDTDMEPWVSIAPTATRLTSVVGDGGSQSITMPFSFVFGEATVAQGTTVYVRADGYLVLSNNPGSHNAYGYYGGGAPVVVPFLLVDGQMPSGSSACYWQTETDADGGQVLAVEFQHVQHWNGSSDNFNYQVRLYENGNVAVHYGHMENHFNDSSFNFMMSSASGIQGDHVVLYGTWDAPLPTAPSTIGSSASSVAHLLSGLPDSGLVVTYVRPEPPCPLPRHVRVEDLEPTTGILSWTGNGVPGCTYEFYLDSVWFSSLYPGSRSLRSTNDSVYWLDSLLPNHHYYGYLRSNCGADLSPWVAFDFWTPCHAIAHAALPFEEDFDSYVGTAASNLFSPGCWRNMNNGSYVANQYQHRAVRMSNTILSLPPIDTVQDLEIAFEAYLQSGTLEVGVIDQAGYLASFVPVATVPLPSGSWTTRSVRLMPYQGVGKAIAFRSTGICLVDNVDVHVAQGCPAVDTVTVDSIGATTARVAWTDANHVGSYRVVCRPLTSALADTLPATASPLILTGLTPDEEYLVTVYALCPQQASDAVAATFHTRCDARTAPYTESFEQADLSRCWTTAGLRFLSSNPVAAAAPGASETTASSGLRSMRLPSRRTTLVGREASWAVAPATTDSVNRLTVEFDYRVPQWYDNVELAVGVTTTEDDTSGFTRQATIRPADSGWHRYHVDLVFYPHGQGRIALLQDNHTNHSYSGSSAYDYGYVDSFVVAPVPSCMRPVALRVENATASSATVVWTDINGVGDYVVSCNGTSTTVYGSTRFVVTGLSPETTYSVSVRTLCDDGPTDSIAATFTTACTGIASLPWTEDFDTWPEESFNSCWARHHAGTTYSEAVLNSGRLRMLSEQWQGVSERTLVVLPPVAVPYGDMAVAFNVMGMNSTIGNTVLELGVLADWMDSATFVPFDTVPFSDEWQYYERALGGIGNGRLALRLTSLSSWRQVYIDDVSLFPAPSCARPDSLLLDSAGLGSLAVRIADDDSAGRYRLWWGVGERTDSADVTGYAYTIGGLHHSTTYDLWAASICPSDSTLSTVLATRMSTACGVISHDDLPWTEDFDHGTGLCSQFLDFHYVNPSADRTTASSHRGASGRSLAPVATDEEPFFYILPEVDSLGSLALDFWTKETLFLHSTVAVGVMDNPADTLTFTPMATVTATDTGRWEKHYVSLGGYSGSGRHVALRVGSPVSFSTTMYIDDVRLVRDLSCMAPDSVSVAAVTDSSALLVVHDPRGVGHYRLYALGDSIDFTTDSIEVQGLGVATEYTLLVASVCVEGLATFPVDVNVVTDCGAYRMPYVEDFETWPVNRMPRCWEVEDTLSYTPAVRTGSMVAGGQKALYGSFAGSDSVVTLVSPQLHFADTDAYVGFSVAVNQGGPDAFHVWHSMPMRMQVSYLGDSSSNALLLYDDYVPSSNPSYTSPSYDWYPVALDTNLIPMGTGRLYFSFFRDTRAASSVFLLDDIVVGTVPHAPPCRPVAALRVDSVGMDAAVVSWTPQGPATEWELRLSSLLGDSLAVSDSVHVALRGLVQGVEYSLVVRPLCDDGQVLWSDSLTFTTLVCPPPEAVAVVGHTAHSATVEWQAPTAGPWLVEYGLSGFARGMGTETVVEAQAPGRVATNIDGLTGNTVYDLYVMTLCDEANRSVWSEAVTFTTEVDGIGEVAGDGRLRLVPNPARGSVALPGAEPGANVTLRDATGRVVTARTLDAPMLDISGLAPGVYFLTLANGENTATAKLVVL